LLFIDLINTVKISFYFSLPQQIQLLSAKEEEKWSNEGWVAEFVFSWAAERMDCCGLWLGPSPLRTTTHSTNSFSLFHSAALPVNYSLLKRRLAPP